MSLQLTSAPAAEPVTLAEARQHLRLDGTDDDAFVSALITTARLQIEAALDQALISQTWSWRLDDLPDDNELQLPLWPVQAIDGFYTVRADGTEIDRSDHITISDFASQPARLKVKRPAETAAAAFGPYHVSFTAGYGETPDSVPAPIRTALLQLVAHWYEHRGPSEVGSNAARIPETISHLLAPYQQVRIA